MTTQRPQGKVPKTISHYRLGALIGSGGMGMVYAATDRRSGVQVAIKLLREELAADRGFTDRFEREAHLGALLRSPYTAELLAYGSDHGLIFIVMEYVEGQPLSGLLRAGPLEVKRALRIAVQVARALEEAEARGIVHRDIKPDNIMVKAGDSVKVLDFGIARQVAGGTLTVAGGFVGTLSYAAPEQAAGHADQRSDIYAVGATLYHMLAGRPPFVGSIVEILGQQREMPMPTEPLVGLPGPVIDLLQKALERDPAARFQSASELAVAIEKAGRLSEVPEMEAHTTIIAAAEAGLPVTDAPASGPADEPTILAEEPTEASDDATVIPTAATPAAPARSEAETSDDATVIPAAAIPAAAARIEAEAPTEVKPAPVSQPPERSSEVAAHAEPTPQKGGRGLLFALLAAGVIGAIAVGGFLVLGSGGGDDDSPAVGAEDDDEAATAEAGETGDDGADDNGEPATPEPETTADPEAPGDGEEDATVGVQISAGGEHSLWLHEDGTVGAFGDDRFGQLADGQGSATPDQCAGFPCSTSPVAVPGLGGVVAVSAGFRHSLALLNDGTVMAWGLDSSGQLGDGPVTPQRCDSADGSFVCSATPVEVAGLSGVVAVSAGGLHSLALLDDGTVAVWGGDGFGQLAGGSAAECEAGPCSVSPLIIPGLTDVVAIAAGFGHSLAVLEDGRVMAWGWDEHGQLGDGQGSAEQCADGPCARTPIEVSGLRGVIGAAAGGGHSLALLEDGSVMAWGWDAFGQLGDGPGVVGSCEDHPCSPVPVQVPVGGAATAVGAGGGTSAALLADGTVVAWGEDAAGQVGDGPESVDDCEATPDCSSSPVAVPGLADVINLAVGDDHLLVLVASGEPLAWGDDSSGKLGNGTAPAENCIDLGQEVACHTTPTPVG